ncbi:MAG: hypothetical protein ACFE0S_14250 [Rhodospirillales bacterium]
MKILNASKNCEVITPHTPITGLFRRSVEIWEGLCNGADVPVWQVDHLLMFPARLVPYANVTRWEPGAGDYRFLFWGSGRTDMMKFDYTSQPLKSLEPAVYADLVRTELNEVLALAKPVKSSAEVLLSDGTSTQVDKVRLPFADETGAVNTVLSIDDVKQFLNRYYLSWVRADKNEKESAEG